MTKESSRASYEDIDYELVTASIGRALEDFARVVEIYERRLEEEARD